jgi:anthranilate phosphoribosyltransferase
MTQSTSWPNILATLIAKQDLSRDEADWAMSQIMDGDSSEAEIGAFMMALRSKGESVEELSGLVDVMLRRCVLLEADSDALDIVGTGGDMVGTVNISTMASIVAAAAGVGVMKHGSRSASGKTGSAEMLEVLGIRLGLSPQRVAEVYKAVGITFFFAPVFHPAMRHVAPARKALGVPTTFNFLGPLANPAQPIATSLGVADRTIAPLMAAEMASRGRNALVFRGSDGLDELTTTGLSDIWLVQGGEVRKFELNPLKLGLERIELASLIGGDAQTNAEVAKRLFNEPGSEAIRAVREIVALNVAGGLVAYELSKKQIDSQKSLEEEFERQLLRAFEALDSGAAASKVAAWAEASQNQ